MGGTKIKAPNDTIPNQQEVFRGFTYETLSVAFHMVAPKEDWRGPIRQCLPSEDFLAVGGHRVFLAAVEYFTGGQATISWTSPRTVLVEAVGYRNGPCGP